MMKIFLKLTLIVSALFLQFSCNEWLELEPPNGLIREEFWQTKEDVESAVMGAYHTFAAMTYCSSMVRFVAILLPVMSINRLTNAGLWKEQFILITDYVTGRSFMR